MRCRGEFVKIEAMEVDEPQIAKPGDFALPEPDQLLGGKVLLVQPQKGFRTPVDSLILGASLSPEAGDTVLDVGCG
ncbi:MAG: hypothetical protein R3360_08725, partial [Alphaproteobacteria bacterium]|nr:hypothetical protein [Alphaproteobacteria bacterium]